MRLHKDAEAFRVSKLSWGISKLSWGLELGAMLKIPNFLGVTDWGLVLGFRTRNLPKKFKKIIKNRQSKDCLFW